MSGDGSRALRGASTAALVAHAALIAFSTIAMLTILSGPVSPALQREPAATIMRIAWNYSGQTYVVLGAMAALFHGMWAFGVRRGAALCLVASGLALGTELLGTSTGFPFGEYAYTSLLGYRVLGLVPFVIPISWFYMLYSALALCARVMQPRSGALAKWLWAAAAAAMLTAWDVAMDPAMVRTSHWVWGEPGIFYGMPLTNWLGWFCTGLLIARCMLAIVPPFAVAARNTREWLPPLLYAANGVMPIAICLRDGLWWAASLGAVAMATPLLLAARGRVRDGAQDERPRALAAT